ncbi:helix-turn-helix transcriptional regulator, partial [Escherichia coli]|nr:helix-turn-helix transcriptional regulator [Escherichia coli]
GVEDFPADLKFYWLHFEVKAPDSDPRWLTHLSVPQQTKVADPQALVALFRQFLSEQEKHQRTPALEFIVLLILQQLTRDARLDEQADGAGTTLAWKAQKLIRTQYHRPLSTALLARELYCNADYLGRVYRRVFHLTLTEAIHRQRVREAEKLLISEARSLTEVAVLCGFNDVGYFRQIFQKHTGLTPAAWKRRYSKEHINS